MFRAKQHSLRLKSLSDLAFVFPSVRKRVAGRGIDCRRDVGRRGEEKERGVKGEQIERHNGSGAISSKWKGNRRRGEAKR